MAIFESVQFLNDTSDFLIEGNLIGDEAINEAVVFKFVKNPKFRNRLKMKL